MTETSDNFKETVDAWIKHINSEFSEIKDLESELEAQMEMIDGLAEEQQHLRIDLESLKMELEAVKFINLISLRQQKARDMKNQKQKEA